MSSSSQILIIALFLSMACALPGTFLVLRNMSMMTDSISHTVLLGIVLMYFLVHDLNSPLLLLGAALMGVLTVWLTELLSKSKLMATDSAIGLIFPFLFSISIILITKYSSHIHLDMDAVMLGEIAFAPFRPLVIGGYNLGAVGMYQAMGLFLLNLTVIVLFLKELTITTFDPILATILGFPTTAIHYGFMTLVSVTAVGAFDQIGSVLVIAFMVVPANTAYLLTHSLKKILALSCFFACISAFLGFHLAYALDVSIPGMMATVSGLLFFLVFLFSPQQGLLRRNNLLKSP